MKRGRIGQISAGDSWRLLRAQPAATYAFIGAHLGMAIFAAGVTMITVWAQDDAKALRIGESLDVSGYTFTLKDMGVGERENYQFMGGNVEISRGGKTIQTVYSERRFFAVRDMVTTEAGLHLSLGNTLFASIGEGNENSGWVVRAYVHPYVVWIWLACLLMAMSGFTALADRRLRSAADDSEQLNILPDTLEPKDMDGVPAE